MGATTELQHRKASRFSARVQSSLFSIAFLILVIHEVMAANFLSQLTLPTALFVGVVVYGSISFLLTMVLATPLEYLLRALLRTLSGPQPTDPIWEERKAPSPSR